MSFFTQYSIMANFNLWTNLILYRSIGTSLRCPLIQIPIEIEFNYTRVQYFCIIVLQVWGFAKKEKPK